MLRTLVALAGLTLVGCIGLDRCAAADEPNALTTVNLFEGGTSFQAVEVSGRLLRLGDHTQSRGTVVVFLSPECPIACRYIPMLKELAAEYGTRGVDLVGVLADPSLTRTAAAKFQQEFGIDFPLAFDASLGLAKRLKPTHTPEAFLFAADGSLRYRGRIDDRFAAIGQERSEVRDRSLRNAMEALLSGDKATEPRHQVAVGCKYEALERSEPRAPTYCRDVAPIVMTHCTGCHRAGEVAPFALTNFAETSKRAEQIAEVVEARYMPPWKAEPGFGHFFDERRLSDDEVAIVKAWAEAGAPEGNAEDLPPLPDFPEGWQLGEPDLVVEFPEAFEIPADGGNIIRYFALPLPPEATGRYVSACEFQPGNRRVVHHSIVFLDVSRIGLAKDRADRKPGYDGFGGPGFPPVGYLGAWIPGATTRRLPEGLGLPVPAGSAAVVMMHYYGSGKPETDRSRLGIYFTDSKQVRPVTSVPVTNTSLEIPPGERHYRVTASFTLPMDATALGVTPHMHYLGREMRVVAKIPGREDPMPLIWVKDWDFNWQGEYQLRTPVRLPKGTTIEVEAFYDNTPDNPRNPHPEMKPVRYGQGTQDEMCLCAVQVALDDLTDFGPFAIKMIREHVRLKDGRLVIMPLE